MSRLTIYAVASCATLLSCARHDSSTQELAPAELPQFETRLEIETGTRSLYAGLS